MTLMIGSITNPTATTARTIIWTRATGVFSYLYHNHSHPYHSLQSSSSSSSLAFYTHDLFNKISTSSNSSHMTMKTTSRTPTSPTRHMSSSNKRAGGFSMVGPKSLNEILKKEKTNTLNKADIMDLWIAYHENKQGMYGSVLEAQQGLTLIQRATECPYFIQPIFRDTGFFVLFVQFQLPCHFFLAYLEDYKMDPHRATPLITFSAFNDLVTSHELSLVRCDIVNRGVEEDEARKVVQQILQSYIQDDEYHTKVQVFNKNPSHFDVDDFISFRNQQWK